MEPIDSFIKKINEEDIQRVSGTAIYFTRTFDRVPTALIHNLKHNKVIHEQIIVLSVQFKSTPRIPMEKRLTLSNLGAGFYSAQINYGFMDRTNIPQAIDLIKNKGVKIETSQLSYFLGRETLIVNGKMGMPVWRETIFAILSRNAQRATRYFKLPAEKVFEVGTNIEI
ncbi:hypothetical protein GCM10007962_08540 [Yeosuana aromativorans]|uniref:K+ potassium transporter C-terminal domain-containing protein n=2 Tax=Yeosuana aromativorans TaxID=288019 RepID=A0A8J3FHZ8_9FLAO|nr:hypothetical protein GCM10007962_08540 [Yeosuana aromativorans]